MSLKLNVNKFIYSPSFVENVDEWKRVYDLKEPQNALLPSPWDKNLNDFSRMTVIRFLRPDKVCFLLLNYKKFLLFDF